MEVTLPGTEHAEPRPGWSFLRGGVFRALRGLEVFAAFQIPLLGLFRDWSLRNVGAISRHFLCAAPIFIPATRHDHCPVRPVDDERS